MTESMTYRLLDVRSSAMAEGPRDALCQLKSCEQLHSYRNKLYNKSSRNRSSDGIKVLGPKDLQIVLKDSLRPRPRTVITEPKSGPH